MVHSLGSNGAGQLGIGHEDDVSIPTKCVLPDGARPASLAAGGNHTVIITTTGAPFGTGHVSDGRCGNVTSTMLSSAGEDRISSFMPFVTEVYNAGNTSKFSLCASTWETSILVSADGKKVFTCGSGNRGELGQGPGIITSMQASCILDLENEDLVVVDVSASMSHAVAVLSNGSVYGWGVGRKGQLGDEKGDCWSPQIIAGIPFKAVRVACGREFTYVVSDPSEGQHIILGSDKWGIQTNCPQNVKNWSNIDASWGSIYVLDASGILQGWGRNDHGQLPPPGLPPIDKFAAGSEHVIAKTRTDDVLVWGWGEHGNCGKPTTDNGDVAGKFNILSVPGHVGFVGAGCATSWTC